MIHSSIITMATTVVILFDSFAHSFSLRPPVIVYKQQFQQQQQQQHPQAPLDPTSSLSRFVARSVSAVHAKNDDSNEKDGMEERTPTFESRQQGFSTSLEKEEEQDEDEIFGYAIDSFLRGDYNQQFADDAPSPIQVCPLVQPWKLAFDHSVR
jgi:hypothetical protein